MEQVKSGFRGQNGCQGDGDGDQAANTARANEIRLQGFKLCRDNF